MQINTRNNKNAYLLKTEKQNIQQNIHATFRLNNSNSNEDFTHIELSKNNKTTKSALELNKRSKTDALKMNNLVTGNINEV